MPIRFRCSRCNRLLGIARRKAGTETTCPHCAGVIRVPLEDGAQIDRTNLEDIDELLNPVVIASAGPANVNGPAPPPLTRAASAAEPLPHDEPPLFERDLDAVLGINHPETNNNGDRPGKNATSGMDAMSLGPPSEQLVLSPQKATALVVTVVVLLGLAFAAGFLIASR